MNGDILQPYDVSARYSDYVYEQCLGAAGQTMNQRVLEAVNRLVPRGAILEVGAGTGRLTIPLAQAGHSVTAVDRSAGMVAELQRKLAIQPADVRERVSVVHKRIERYHSQKRRFDLVLSVFTVLNHLPDDASMEAFAHVAFQRLRPGGYLLIGMATEPVMVPGTMIANRAIFNIAGLLHRELVLEARQDSLCRRDDWCEGTFQEGRFNYREVFDWRIWNPNVVKEILERVGFQRSNDVDVPTRMDADCFLFKKPNPKRHGSPVDDDDDLHPKELDPLITGPVAELADGDPAVPEGRNAEGHEPLTTLPALSLTALIDLMRATGFWLNPNLRTDPRHGRGDFTNLLPHLARCRMLVQCNPNKPSAEVHDWMTRMADWREFGQARVHQVHHVPVTGDSEVFQNPQHQSLDRALRFMFQVAEEAVDLRADQRWLRYYLVSYSLDAQHERLLRVVHLGCHPLTAFAVFFSPNRLRPEGIAKPPWPWRPDGEGRRGA